MNQDELLDHFDEVVDRCRETLVRKNNDYSGKSNENPFSNFEVVERINLCDTETGFVVRIMDKIKRIVTFINSGELEVKDEPVDDAIEDIINYMILLHAYAADKREESPDPEGLVKEAENISGGGTK